MIHGMAITGRLLNKPDYIESTSKAAYFLKKQCWKNGQLFASIKDGKVSLKAYLDDYAFLIYGLLELLQSRWDNTLYQWARWNSPTRYSPNLKTQNMVAFISPAITTKI